MCYAFFFTFWHCHINQTPFSTLTSNREKYNFKILKPTLNCFKLIILNFFSFFDFRLIFGHLIDLGQILNYIWLSFNLTLALTMTLTRRNFRSLRNLALSLRSSRINKNFCTINHFEKFYFFCGFHRYFFLNFLGFSLRRSSWVHKNFCTVYNFKELYFF
jgi:hypothetical protein